MKRPPANGTFNPDHVKAMFPNAKIILVPILTKILRLLLIAAGSALSGWLISRHLISQGDQSSILGLCGDAAPFVLASIPGIWWDVYAWLNKFDFFVKLETVLRLPITGQPAPGTITQAAINKTLADSSVSSAAFAAPPPMQTDRITSLGVEPK